MLFTRRFKAVAKVEGLGARIGVDDIEADGKEAIVGGMGFDRLKEGSANTVAARRFGDENAIHEKCARLDLPLKQRQQGRTPKRTEPAINARQITEPAADKTALPRLEPGQSKDRAIRLAGD